MLEFLAEMRSHSPMPAFRNPKPEAGPRGVVPYNRGLYDLVRNKNQWQDSPDAAEARAGFRGWHQRGYLPHRDAPGLVQFVTFRLADAFPSALRSEWEALLKVEEERSRLRKLEDYLDAGRGECHLRQPALAALVEEGVRFFHGARYDLQAWVVMPNHVHVMFVQGKASLGAVVGSWKSYTAKQANRMLRRTGAFWAEDYWDTYMRDDAHQARAQRYIENNPAKAHLVLDPHQWPWSSARFRDQYEQLRLPA
jgi:REP element-mobilizing transposase RayT